VLFRVTIISNGTKQTRARTESNADAQAFVTRLRYCDCVSPDDLIFRDRLRTRISLASRSGLVYQTKRNSSVDLATVIVYRARYALRNRAANRN